MHPERALAESADLKVHWARPHPGPFLWGLAERMPSHLDFSESDAEVRLLQSYDSNPIVTIWPYADWDQKRCRQPVFASVWEFKVLGDYRQKPCDLAAYGDFVRAVVERYDGDGVADMPGLKYPVKYWEAANEPELSPRVFFYGPAQDYLEVLRATYEAVKTADPGAKVLHGGAAGLFVPDFRSFWQRVLDLGGARYFDIFNCHAIGVLNEERIQAAVAFAKQNRLQQPHWMPEVEFEARALGRDRLQPEEWARVLVRSFVYAFGEGVDKLFYVGLDQSPGDWESWLLLPQALNPSAPKTKQATYYAFRTMVEKLDYFTDVKRLQEGQYRFMVKGKPVYVIWSRDPLPAEITGPVTVTDVFGQARKAAAATIALSDSPVFIEPSE